MTIVILTVMLESSGDMTECSAVVGWRSMVGGGGGIHTHTGQDSTLYRDTNIVQYSTISNP